MRADIAFSERAVDRIGDRMQRDIRIGMALELSIVGDAHASKPDAVPGRKGVDVEALADPDLGRSGRQTRLGFAQILHRGYLYVVRLAFENEGRVSGRLGDGRVVRQISARGFVVRREDQIEAEGLRRLHGAQARSLRRGDDPALGVDLLDRVGHRRCGNRGPVARAASMARETSSFEGNGRAPSWISTMSGRRSRLRLAARCARSVAASRRRRPAGSTRRRLWPRAALRSPRRDRGRRDG